MDEKITIATSNIVDNTESKLDAKGGWKKKEVTEKMGLLQRRYETINE